MRNRPGADIFRHVPACCVFVLLALISMACGRSGSPLAPSPGPDPVAPPPVTSPAFTISGSVASNDDAPLRGARIEIVEGANTGTSVTANDDGRYVVGDLPAGAYVLRATLDGFHASTSSLSLNGDRALDFRLTPAPGEPAPEPPAPGRHWTLSGVVSDASTGTAVTGARVEITEGTNRGRETTTNADGRFEIADLEAGRFTLRATAEDYKASATSVPLESNSTVEIPLERETPSGPDVSGRAIDVLSGAPLPGVVVRIDGGAEATTSTDGTFTVTGAAGGTQRVSLSSDATVARQTQVRVPGDVPTLTLIPRSLDLHSFDEMLRARGGLHRWVTAPRLIIERRVLAFTNTTDMSYVATEHVMSDADASALAADLAWALPQLTGGTFPAFASVDIQTAAEGAAVSISQSGAIVVARFEGLESAIAAWGYGRWAWNAAGEVQMGAIMLDRAFDTSSSPHRRSLRAHELGHALGYDHVSGSHSAMNASGRIEPTSFDMDATTIAFRRTPLNQSPDIDPDPVTVNRAKSTRGVVWGGAK